jgi:hypothetical protein
LTLTTLISQHFSIHKDDIKHLPLEVHTDASYKSSSPHYSQILFPSEPYDIAAKTSASIIMLDPTKLRHEQETFIISINNINTDGHSNAFDGEFTAINVAN